MWQVSHWSVNHQIFNLIITCMLCTIWDRYRTTTEDWPVQNLDEVMEDHLLLTYTHVHKEVTQSQMWSLVAFALVYTCTCMHMHPVQRQCYAYFHKQGELELSWSKTSISWIQLPGPVAIIIIVGIHVLIPTQQYTCFICSVLHPGKFTSPSILAVWATRIVAIIYTYNNDIIIIRCNHKVNHKCTSLTGVKPFNKYIIWKPHKIRPSPVQYQRLEMKENWKKT